MILIKKFTIGILFFIIGLGLSVFVESHLRTLIQDLYRLSTDNAIMFVGKNFHLFASPFYYVAFGFWTLTMWIAYKELSIKQKLLKLGLTLGAFILALGIACFLGSNLMVAQCTACKDGILRIHYNEIDYTLIVIISLAVSTIPPSAHIIKSKPVHNNRIKQAPSQRSAIDSASS